MKFKIGDDITFDGSIDKTKEVAYSGLKTAKERMTDPYSSEGHITRFMVLQPHSHLRVTGIWENKYYVCEKLWETGDEEIPIGGRGVLVHMDEAIPYLDSYNGTVKNKRK